MVDIVSLIVSQAASAPADLPVGDALAELAGLVGGMKGASVLAVALALVQAVMLFFKTSLAGFAGKWKLTIALGLAVVTTALGLKLAGASWGAALLAGPVMGALQSFAHQLFKQFAEKPTTSPGAEK